MKLALIIINITLIFSTIHGQNQSKLLEIEGDKMILEGKLYSAIELYENAAEMDSINIQLNYKLAENLSRSLNFCKSIKYYERALKNDINNELAVAIYKLGKAQKNCGKYEEALLSFNKALIQTDENPELKQLYSQILHEITSVQFALNHINDSIKYNIQHLPSPINTENSEFNPVILPGNRIVYTSYRTLFNDTFSNIFSTTYISEILVSKLSRVGWNSPTSFDNKINSTKFLTANICFANNYNTAFFTRCSEQNGSIGQCIIYRSDKKNGQWSKPKKLPETINHPEYSSTQPFWYKNEDYEVLYFASNKPGSYGGMDIWYSIIKNDEYQIATNLGNVINTVGNEITPHYSDQQQALFFSSDWHESFGGYDIFISKGGLSQWQKPVNMGIPINSENNDLYYTPMHNNEVAYLSSNRLGSITSAEADYCCGDIYLITSEMKPKTNNPTPFIIDTIPQNIEQKIIQLLPITLYFDNDQPNPRTTSDYTEMNFEELLNNYINQIEIYQMEYSRGLKNEEKLAAIDSITDFFNEEVLSGFEKLQRFKQLLKQEIDSGKTVTIKIIGFASPLNTAEYNYHLSKRRIQSVKNYLLEIEGGYFSKYMNDSVEPARIILIEDARGDRNSSKYVSSNPNDKRNSVYSKAAAMERKIQIIMYSSSDNQQINNELLKLQIQSIYVENDSIPQNKNLKGTIILKNTGNQPLEIKRIIADTSVQIQTEKQEIATNEQGKIYFLLNTHNIPKGKNQIKMTIETNATQNTEIQINYTVY